jgi:hypothetical protein
VEFVVELALVLQGVDYRLSSALNFFSFLQLVLYLSDLNFVQRTGLLLPVASNEWNGVFVVEQRSDSLNLLFLDIEIFSYVFGCFSQCNLPR